MWFYCKHYNYMNTTHCAMGWKKKVVASDKQRAMGNVRIELQPCLY